MSMYVDPFTPTHVQQLLLSTMLIVVVLVVGVIVLVIVVLVVLVILVVVVFVVVITPWSTLLEKLIDALPIMKLPTI